MRKYVFICWLAIAFANVCASETDSILQVLFVEMNYKELYTNQREERIRQLESMLNVHSITAEQRYHIYDDLAHAYNTFQMDSTLHYLDLNKEIAEFLGDMELLYHTKIQLASAYWLKGRTLEAEKELDSINRELLTTMPKQLLMDYYDAYKCIYLYYSENDRTNPYYKQMALYRDSLLSLVEPNSFSYTIQLSEKLADEDRLPDAIQALQQMLAESDNENRERAIAENILSTFYQRTGNVEMQKKHLALSAIYDLKNAIKENASMMNLAFLLYEEGKIDLAYRCMLSSLNDAIFCNAHFRAYEIAKLFPVINSAYQELTLRQERKLHTYLISVSILAILLVVAAIYSYWEMRRVARIRKELSETNRKLNELNANLHTSNMRTQKLNDELSSVNLKLSETNKVKEGYLGKFIELCSDYIEKMDDYRRGLHRLVQNGEIETLAKQLRSYRFIDKELDNFFINFDETFLRIYPTFIEEFNGLFPPDKRQVPKSNALLNTELRIYALIRLGITDSAKIAGFIRHSISTIYSYRSQLKNSSLQPEKFEENVRKIGLLTHQENAE